ncbi:MAG: hypothetical protein ACODAE_04580 [Gemmatimonadota bacterium]
MAQRERRRRKRWPARRPGEDGRERHAPHEELAARRAHAARNSPGRERPGRTGRTADGVLVQVCERCGKAYFFDETEPPADLTCEKCGGVVFRSFFDVSEYDEVEDDFRRSTERDLAPNDDESDVTRADVLDLNNP